MNDEVTSDVPTPKLHYQTIINSTAGLQSLTNKNRTFDVIIHMESRWKTASFDPEAQEGEKKA